MKLTFGKWQGWDTEDLAKTIDGRNYLAWGSERLKSPKWKAEFSRALAANTELDKALSIRAAMHDANISQEEAEIYVGDYFTQAEIAAKMLDLDNRFRKYLVDNGISPKGANFIINHIFDLAELNELEKAGRIKFASKANKQIVIKGLTHYLNEVEKIRI